MSFNSTSLLISPNTFLDSGDYNLTIYATDELGRRTYIPAKLNIKIIINGPRLVSTPPPNIIFMHGKTKIINLASYFTDDDNDTLFINATYSRNGLPSVSIPEGIFTIYSNSSIIVASTSIADTDSYKVDLTIKDIDANTLNSSFTIDICNTAPKLVSPLLNQTIYHGPSASILIDLTSSFVDDELDLISMSAVY